MKPLMTQDQRATLDAAISYSQEPELYLLYLREYLAELLAALPQLIATGKGLGPDARRARDWAQGARSQIRITRQRIADLSNQ